MRKTDNRSSTGHSVRAGCALRAINVARVGNALRVTDIVRVRHTINTRPKNQGCGMVKKMIGPAHHLVRCIVAHAYLATAMSS